MNIKGRLSYGLPYLGSKNKIADKLMVTFPERENFYDLFGGGFAVTHKAFLSDKYRHIYANDIDNAVVELFMNAVKGKYTHFKFTSHDEYFEKKYTDKFISVIWSFGNANDGYIYSSKIVDFKKAFHELIFDNNTEHFTSLTSIPVPSEITSCTDMDMKYILIKKLLREHRGELFIGNSRHIEELQHFERFVRVRRLSELNTEKFNNTVHFSSKSYDKIQIKDDSVIYCDIPYMNKRKNMYWKNLESEFDYNSFYDWCRNQKELTFISSYSMPDDFIQVNEIIHHTKFEVSTQTVEKLFIPKHQKDLIKG